MAEQQHIIVPFRPGAAYAKKSDIRSTQRKRRNADKFSAWTELIGVRLPKPDDPVLLQFKTADDESRPLRLVMSVRP